MRGVKLVNHSVAGFKLSVQQERAWRQQDRSSMFAACVLRLEGPLDETRLRAALQDVIRRHEILRTVFHQQASVEVPFQVIDKAAVAHWHSIEALGSTEELLRQCAAGFDLQRGPVVRAILCRVATNQYTLILQAPALIADAVSLRILVAELGGSYAGASGDSATDPLQYADFVEWQNELLVSDDTRAGRDYWRDYCRTLDGGASAVLPLESGTEGARFQPAEVAAALGPTEVSRLEAMSRRRSVAVPELFAACWNLLLSRLTGQPEITLGHEFDGRKYTELEMALGPFAKSLPLRPGGKADEPFATFLDRVKSAVAAARSWEESFTWSQCEGHGGRDDGAFLPLQFSYHELPEKRLYGDVWFQVVRQEVQAERFKLKLEVQRSADQLQLRFHYDAARLAHENVARWASHFRTMLAAAVESPETPIGRLSLLNDAERRQLLYDWNQT
ncbi:MAG: amino acid adenylation domain protein, partial [Gammaproteobacteria bacterium]|nr:amino acid adenylation domain protein [Gammaproteobacteria bacterium]